MCNTNTILFADCDKVTLSITANAGPPYEPGYQLMCAAAVDGDPDDDLKVEWVGSNGGSYYYSSDTPNVTLLGGEFCLTCIATFDILDRTPKQPFNCSHYAVVCDIATGTYRKQRNGCVFFSKSDKFRLVYINTS